MRNTTIAALAAILLAGSAQAAPMSSYTTKATPVGADSVLINDSEAANATKKATLSSILALWPYTVGTAANNLVQLNASAQLPAVSADLLTITDTGSYFTTDTVGAALQELGGAPELLFGTEFTETAGTGTVTLTLDFPVTSEIYGAGWATDTEGAQRDDIYAILHVGDTDDDGMADVLDSVVSAEELRATGMITGLMPSVVITTAEGTDDTSTDAAFLTDSGESWPVNGYVGMPCTTPWTAPVAWSRPIRPPP